MKVFLVLAFFAGSLFAQTPGTVTVNSATNVTAVASSVNCVLHKKSSLVVTVTCKVLGVTMLTSTTTIGANRNGTVGDYTNAGDSVTWLVNQPQGQTSLSWQMAANGTQKSGTF